MTKVFLVLVALTATAGATKPKQLVVDAEVTKIGDSFWLACGIFMSTQPIEVRVTKVGVGKAKAGETLIVDVMTCFEGPLLRKVDDSHGFRIELDPSKIRAGSRIHVELEEHGKDRWFATTDKIAVKKH